MVVFSRPVDNKAQTTTRPSAARGSPRRATRGASSLAREPPTHWTTQVGASPARARACARLLRGVCPRRARQGSQARFRSAPARRRGSGTRCAPRPPQTDRPPTRVSARARVPQRVGDPSSAGRHCPAALQAAAPPHEGPLRGQIAIAETCQHSKPTRTRRGEWIAWRSPPLCGGGSGRATLFSSGFALRVPVGRSRRHEIPSAFGARSSFDRHVSGRLSRSREHGRAYG